jgi:hypothetical protein
MRILIATLERGKMSMQAPVATSMPVAWPVFMSKLTTRQKVVEGTVAYYFENGSRPAVVLSARASLAPCTGA